MQISVMGPRPDIGALTTNSRKHTALGKPRELQKVISNDDSKQNQFCCRAGACDNSAAKSGDLWPRHSNWDMSSKLTWAVEKMLPDLHSTCEWHQHGKSQSRSPSHQQPIERSRPFVDACIFQAVSPGRRRFLNVVPAVKSFA